MSDPSTRPPARRLLSRVASRSCYADTGPGRSVAAHATLDDYLAGRCDRLGREILVCLRPTIAWRTDPLPWLPSALELTAPLRPVDVDAILHEDPDVIWLHAMAPVLAAAAVPLLRSACRQIIIIDD